MFQFTHPGRGATGVNGIPPILQGSFNSRTPGGVRLNHLILRLSSECFNSRTPGGVRRGAAGDRRRAVQVSIHAPREGCDGEPQAAVHRRSNVSIHAPREGCDSSTLAYICVVDRFQFTHPGRGATSSIGSVSPDAQFQFTHPGRGATERTARHTRLPLSFNSRTPGGVRRRGARPDPALPQVSIHAPREGCDLFETTTEATT